MVGNSQARMRAVQNAAEQALLGLNPMFLLAEVNASEALRYPGGNLDDGFPDFRHTVRLYDASHSPHAHVDAISIYCDSTDQAEWDHLVRDGIKRIVQARVVSRIADDVIAGRGGVPRGT